MNQLPESIQRGVQRPDLALIGLREGAQLRDRRRGREDTAAAPVANPSVVVAGYREI